MLSKESGYTNIPHCFGMCMSMTVVAMSLHTVEETFLTLEGAMYSNGNVMWRRENGADGKLANKEKLMCRVWTNRSYEDQNINQSTEKTAIAVTTEECEELSADLNSD